MKEKIDFYSSLLFSLLFGLLLYDAVFWMAAGSTKCPAVTGSSCWPGSCSGLFCWSAGGTGMMTWPGKFDAWPVYKSINWKQYTVLLVLKSSLSWLFSWKTRLLSLDPQQTR